MGTRIPPLAPLVEGWYREAAIMPLGAEEKYLQRVRWWTNSAGVGTLCRYGYGKSRRGAFNGLGVARCIAVH
jgi:hypothetical protein